MDQLDIVPKPESIILPDNARLVREKGASGTGPPSLLFDSRFDDEASARAELARLEKLAQIESEAIRKPSKLFCSKSDDGAWLVHSMVHPTSHGAFRTLASLLMDVRANDNYDESSGGAILKDADMIKICATLCDAICACDAGGMAHGAVHPDHVLLDSDLNASLCVVPPPPEPTYNAPEFFADTPTVEASIPADMFSLGLIIYSMLTFADIDAMEQPLGQRFSDSAGDDELICMEIMHSVDDELRPFQRIVNDVCWRTDPRHRSTPKKLAAKVAGVGRHLLAMTGNTVGDLTMRPLRADDADLMTALLITTMCDYFPFDEVARTEWTHDQRQELIASVLPKVVPFLVKEFSVYGVFSETGEMLASVVFGRPDRQKKSDRIKQICKLAFKLDKAFLTVKLPKGVKRRKLIATHIKCVIPRLKLSQKETGRFLDSNKGAYACLQLDISPLVASEMRLTLLKLMFDPIMSWCDTSDSKIIVQRFGPYLVADLERLGFYTTLEKCAGRSVEPVILMQRDPHTRSESHDDSVSTGSDNAASLLGASVRRRTTGHSSASLGGSVGANDNTDFSDTLSPRGRQVTDPVVLSLIESATGDEQRSSATNNEPRYMKAPSGSGNNTAYDIPPDMPPIDSARDVEASGADSSAVSSTSTSAVEPSTSTSAAEPSTSTSAAEPSGDEMPSARTLYDWHRQRRYADVKKWLKVVPKEERRAFRALVDDHKTKRGSRVERAAKKEGKRKSRALAQHDQQYDVPPAELLRARELDYSRLKMIREIGSGSYGVVHLCTLNGREVAVKELAPQVKRGPTAAAVERAFLQEMSVLRALKPHANVVEFIASCTSPPAIVLEYCEHGSLDVYLQSKELSAGARCYLLKDVAEGVAHLHDSGVVHRDLACRNLLLSAECVKLCDLGLAREVVGDSGVTNERVGPLRYMAPEAIENGVYSAQSDAWAYAVTAWEVETRCSSVPYPELTAAQASLKVCRDGLHPQLPDHTATALVALLESCWNVAPSKRPSMAAISEALDDIMVDVGAESYVPE